MGKSIKTGPILPCVAIAKAFEINSLTEFTFLIRVEYFETVFMVLAASNPCTPYARSPKSLSQWKELSFPAIIITGTESRNALNIPVNEFAAPPPVVTSATPILPLTRE